MVLPVETILFTYKNITTFFGDFAHCIPFSQPYQLCSTKLHNNFWLCELSVVFFLFGSCMWQGGQFGARAVHPWGQLTRSLVSFKWMQTSCNCLVGRPFSLFAAPTGTFHLRTTFVTVLNPVSTSSTSRDF